MKKSKILAGTAIAVCLSSEAFAQSNDDGDEIIVTAQKREQNVQDVPITIQVIDTEGIEALAADSMADIDTFIPGLEVGSGSPTQPRYSIRGIQTSDFGVGTDPAVGVYVDGVYAARSGASLLAFNDVERIEVVKGPQGTLFGRNSSAGAVSIITKKPSQEFEAELGLRYGNFNKRRAEAMVNIPVSEDIALRFNGVINKRDGLFTDAGTGEDLNFQNNWALRGALGWDIGPSTNVLLRYSHDELDQDARPAIGIVETFEYPDSPPVPPDPSTYLNPFDVEIRNDVINNSETRSLDEAVLTVTHDFNDNLQLTSLSAWRQFDTNNREDEDGTADLHTYFDTNNIESNESIYQEFRLAGNNDRLSWLAGVSYFDENANQVSSTNTNSDTIDTLIQNVIDGRRLFRIVQLFVDVFEIDAQLFGHTWQEDMFNRGDFSAYAAFADATYEIDDQLSVTVGGRYTRDKKKFSWFNELRTAEDFDENLLAAGGIISALGASVDDFMVDFVFDLSGLAGVPCDNGVTVAEGVECINKDVFTDFSPRVVADYKLNDDTLLFASYTQGYKAGGYNSVEVSSRFDNEDVDNYEAGFKTTFRDANFRLNGSLFHYKYKNKQSISLVQDVAGSGVPQYLVQTSDEKATGGDLEGEWRPADGLTLRANMQYLDQTYADRITREGIDLTGEPTGQPKWSYAFGGQYRFDLDDIGQIDVQAMHSYRGGTRCNSIAVAQGTCDGGFSNFTIGGPRERTDLRAYWRNPSERYQIGVYANNVFDNRYIGGVNNLTADVLGTPFSSISEPRFYGVDFKFTY